MNDEKEKKSSFVEHLAELRSRFIKSIVYLFLFFVVCYFFSENIYSFLVTPYADAVKEDKKQLFAITNKAQTIGRVYDSRYDAVISGGAKFPLGLWKNNEKREFESIYYYSNGKIKKYIKSIKIESFNYKYSGKKDCLKFRWVIKIIDSISISTFKMNTNYRHIKN